MGFLSFWGSRESDVSIGSLIAIVVLVIVVVALVFRAAAPDWLPYVIDGALALAILLSVYPLRRVA